ncbi:MAG: CHASE3 domain-containing protein, partial [Thermoguttaceae bacterium]
MFSNIKIGRKLFINSAVLLALLVFTAFTGWNGLNKVLRGINQIDNSWNLFEKVESVQKAMRDVQLITVNNAVMSNSEAQKQSDAIMSELKKEVEFIDNEWGNTLPEEDWTLFKTQIANYEKMLGDLYSATTTQNKNDEVRRKFAKAFESSLAELEEASKKLEANEQATNEKLYSIEFYKWMQKVDGAVRARWIMGRAVRDVPISKTPEGRVNANANYIKSKEQCRKLVDIEDAAMNA